MGKKPKYKHGIHIAITSETIWIPCVVDGSVVFIVLQDEFDHSTCRRDTDFSGIEKKLVINEIFYIGELTMK